MAANANLTYETIMGEVVSKASHYIATQDRNGKWHINKDGIIRAYEDSFKDQCRLYRDRNISKPFKFHCRIYYRNPSHDLDNSLKTVLDCLQQCKAISNDSLAVEIHAYKHRDTKHPRIEFAIEEIQPTLQFA